MLLSKLNLVSALVLAVVVGAGAVGLTYRPAEAQPAASNRAAPSARAAADELEELRLEVAALRKGLEVTRERVKALEEEVRTLRPAGSPPGATNVQGTWYFRKSELPTRPDSVHSDPTRPPDVAVPGPRTDSYQRTNKRRTQPPPKDAGGNPFGAATDRPLQGTPDVTHQPSQPPADPLAQAEVAFKKLRINPGDRQATQALERALKELKARDAFRRTYPQGSGGDAPTKP